MNILNWWLDLFHRTPMSAMFVVVIVVVVLYVAYVAIYATVTEVWETISRDLQRGEYGTLLGLGLMIIVVVGVLSFMFQW